MNRQIRRTGVVGRERVAKEEVEEVEVVAAASVVDQNTKNYVRSGIPKSGIDATIMRKILSIGIT
jgi:hypothetical protein